MTRTVRIFVAGGTRTLLETRLSNNFIHSCIKNTGIVYSIGTLSYTSTNFKKRLLALGLTYNAFPISHTGGLSEFEGKKIAGLL